MKLSAMETMSFAKREFFAQINNIRAQAFKTNSILECFRQTGLIPFNPEIVMKKLKDLLPQDPPPKAMQTPQTPIRANKKNFPLHEQVHQHSHYMP